MRTSKVTAAGLLLAFFGCVNAHEELTVMPDGSGKVTLHLILKTKSDAAKFTEAELLTCDPDEIQEKVRGLVAMTRPASEEKEGAVHLRMTGYFDDVNALKFMDEGEGPQAKPKQEFSFRREGGTFVLEIRGNLLADDVPIREDKDPELARQREQFFKAMYVGFEFRQDVRLPGKVTAVEGFGSFEGRLAKYQIQERDLQKPSDQAKINGLSRFRAACGRSEVSETEAAEWKSELEKAKADWVPLRQEMKKAAAKK